MSVNSISTVSPEFPVRIQRSLPDSPCSFPIQRVRGVQDEVQEDLLQPLRVRHHLIALCLQGEADPHLLHHGLRLQDVHGSRKEVVDMGRLQLSAGRPGEVQELPDDPVDPRDLNFDAPQEVLSLLLGHIPLTEQFQISQGDADGIADFVGDPRRQAAHGGQLLGSDEIALGLLQIPVRLLQGDDVVPEVPLVFLQPFQHPVEGAGEFPDLVPGGLDRDGNLVPSLVLPGHAEELPYGFHHNP